MMVDLSHAAESTFYDALAVSKVPIVCSHSSSKVLCNHPRNLTDDQLRALAVTGGVAQCTFYCGFLRTDEENATLDDAVAHMLHMIKVAGVDHSASALTSMAMVESLVWHRLPNSSTSPAVCKQKVSLTTIWKSCGVAISFAS